MENASGASLTQPCQASECCKVGHHVMIKNRPCKIVDVSKSKPGKHGSAKLNYTGIDIFTDNKLQDINPAHAMVDTPLIKRCEYRLLDIDDDDGYMSLLDDNGNTKDDMKIGSGDVAEEAKKKFENGDELIVTILMACGEERLVASKIATD